MSCAPAARGACCDIACCWLRSPSLAGRIMQLKLCYGQPGFGRTLPLQLSTCLMSSWRYCRVLGVGDGGDEWAAGRAVHSDFGTPHDCRGAPCCPGSPGHLGRCSTAHPPGTGMSTHLAADATAIPFDGLWLTTQLNLPAEAHLCPQKAAWLQEQSGSPPRHWNRQQCRPLFRPGSRASGTLRHGLPPADC